MRNTEPDPKADSFLSFAESEAGYLLCGDAWFYKANAFF